MEQQCSSRKITLSGDLTVTPMLQCTFTFHCTLVKELSYVPLRIGAVFHQL